MSMDKVMFGVLGAYFVLIGAGAVAALRLVWRWVR